MIGVFTLTAVLGLVAGSFANAVIYRLAHPKIRQQSFSCCPQCGHRLRAVDLVPLVSFVVTRGRCRYCQAPISWQYPLVELAAGVLFVLVLQMQLPIFSGNSLSAALAVLDAIFLFGAVISLIIIFVYDLRYYLIPDEPLYAAAAFAAAHQVLAFLRVESGAVSIGYSGEAMEAALASIGATAFFWIIYKSSGGRWLGFGDVLLVFVMGLLLGFPNILVALFAAFVGGGIIGGALLAASAKHLKSELPFAPFLILGTFTALFWGEQIVRWYLSIAGI